MVVFLCLRGNSEKSTHLFMHQLGLTAVFVKLWLIVFALPILLVCCIGDNI